MNGKSRLIIELHCFPSVSFFKTVKPYQKVALENSESFPKQTYRSRFDILTANGIQTLSIPLKKYPNNTSYADIEIDYKEDWQKKMIKTLESAYASSPYFEYYIDDIKKILGLNSKHLLDFNVNVLKLVINWLDQKWDFEFTNSYKKVYINDDDKRDLTKRRKSTSDWECDISTYRQVFGKEFVPHLSVLDLIFCQGPLSPKYI